MSAPAETEFDDIFAQLCSIFPDRDVFALREFVLERYPQRTLEQLVSELLGEDGISSSQADSSLDAARRTTPNFRLAEPICIDDADESDKHSGGSGSSSAASAPEGRLAISDDYIALLSRGGGSSLSSSTSSARKGAGTKPGEKAADQLAQIRQQKRDEYRRINPSAKSAPYQRGRACDAGMMNQVQEARQRQAKKWRSHADTPTGNRMFRKMMTLSDLREKERAKLGDLGSKGGLERIGRRALELTNEFRQSQGLQPLQWSTVLWDIGLPHSKDMGEGRVPFGHDGFNKRMSMFPGHCRSFAENVAMSRGAHDPAKVAVDGWIKSPGHRKNLVGNFTLCAISVYANASGAVYLTQLFAYA